MSNRAITFDEVLEFAVRVHNREMTALKAIETNLDDAMDDVQQLAYDAERWPHCIDLPAQRT